MGTIYYRTRSRLADWVISVCNRTKGAVAFRNIRLRPMGLKPLFNGEDFEGWNKERAEKCKFECDEEGRSCT